MGYVILFAWLIILPFCAGGIFHTVKKNNRSFAAQWLWGQFFLWAVFQVVAVYFVLKSGKLSDIIRVYVIVTVCVAAVGLLNTARMWIKEHKSGQEHSFLWIKPHKEKRAEGRTKLAARAGNRAESKAEKKALTVLTVIFALLWLVQMLAIVFLAVNDGDDSYYMAVANIAENADTLYIANAYSFGGTELAYRYALAPFPIWIAFLSRISGVHTLIIGHVILGIVLVTMSYVVYAQTGRELFGGDRKKRLMLLIFIAVLYIWGNTSSHTAESFLILRSRQGKALVAGLVFPAMICLIIQIGRTLEQQRKITVGSYFLAAMIILTGCLGSTLGGSLVILLWGSALLLLTIGYKKWSLLPAGVLSAVPGFVYAVIYLLHL